MHNQKLIFSFLVILTIFFSCDLALAQDQKPKSPISDTINEHLPKWIRIGGEYRLRWEGRSGQSGKVGNNDNYLLSRFRLDFTIKPNKHWTFFIQAQDSEVFGFNTKPAPAIHQDAFDLRQAYIEWKQEENHGWNFRVGRQELNFGDQRLIGSLNWTNTARTFDAVKVGYTHTKYTVDVFASSVVAIDDEHFDKHRDGNNLYGVYATFPKAVPKAKLSTYVFWKTNPLVLSEKGIRGDADVVTFGSSLFGKFNPHVTYEIDGMWQRGNFSKDTIKAHAVHSRLGYNFAPKKEKLPNVYVEYNHASGDGSPGDGTYGTFDQLFPTGHALYGLIDQVGLRNQHDARIGSNWQPTKKLKFQLDYHSIWLAHRKDGLYNAGGALVARVPNGSAGSHVAQEIDLQVTYTPRPGITIGGGYAHWIPGEFWKHATPGSKQSFGYTFLTYRF